MSINADEEGIKDAKRAANVRRKAKPRNNEELLKTQGEALTRIIKYGDMSVTELARKLQVDRVTIYTWMNAKNAVPEDKLMEIAQIYKVEPAEIRYNVAMYNRDDLMYVISLFESALTEHELELNPEERAKIITFLYGQFQRSKNRINISIARDDIKDDISHKIQELLNK